MNRMVIGLLVLCVWLTPSVLSAAEEPRSVEAIARASRASVVVIHSTNRQGQQRGLGSGFVVRADGVIATNFHVIGQRRDFTVKLTDGKSYRPRQLLGFDRDRDLALVQIDAQNLPVLQLGDSDKISSGQTVVAVGNPLGLEFSVTQGVVAARRDVYGQAMIQVAMPIEPGSSGSPLVDLHGHVVGVVSMKSQGNFGFAVPVNDLKRVLKNPRTIDMKLWMTIGALDPMEWETRLGGIWRQRAGRLLATGMGDGFGGRTLCLSKQTSPEGEYELEVEVRLEDESGAAGLVFHSDGAYRHYGFYPTAGSLRLTRFEGPDVFTWTILKTQASRAYRPGRWNRIKVRVGDGRYTCYVNDQVVMDIPDNGFTQGKVGLVKFRSPGAEFRRFRVGNKLAATAPAPEALAAVADVSRLLRLDSTDAVDKLEAEQRLTDLGHDAVEALRNRSVALEEEAKRLAAMASRVHERVVCDQLRRQFRAGEEVDLLHAALLLARLDNPELEVEAYLSKVRRMTRQLLERAKTATTPEMKLKVLGEYLFQELGFHGSRAEYFDRSNSFINEVLDDREGLPITLSVVFMELGRRLELDVRGVGVPRHFIVMLAREKTSPILIDVFGGGKQVSRAEVEALCGTTLNDSDFKPATKRSIITRMLNNLIGVAERERDEAAMLRYVQASLAVDNTAAYRRWMRAVLLYRSGRRFEAVDDLDWLLKHSPPGVDLRPVRELRETIPAVRRERAF